MNRNVIFDLDGTLIDSRPGILAGLRHALRCLGHELPADWSLDWAIGPPLLEVMTRLLAPLGDDRAREATCHYREWYGTVGLFDARPYPGVPEMLEQLSALGKASLSARPSERPLPGPSWSISGWPAGSGLSAARSPAAASTARPT